MYGANRALLELMKGVKASGLYEPVAVLPAEGEFTDVLKSQCISYIICGITPWAAIYREPISFNLKRKKRLAAIDNEIGFLYERLKDEDIAFIHSNSSIIGHGAILSERLGCRHIWHIREFAREHYGMVFFYPEEWVERYFTAADRLVAISEAVKDNYERSYPEAKVTRIYDGIKPVDDIENSKAENAVTEFLYTAYIFPAKRQMDVLLAAKMLLKKGVKEFRITFAGDGDKAYLKKLKAFVKRNSLESFADFAGFVSDIKPYLKKADTGIIASEYEGFGLVTCEYMQYALPVIGRRSGATPEIIEDGISGFLYDDINGLAEAMEKLIRDKDLRSALGESGRTRVLKEFTDERNVAEILKLYGEVENG